MSDILGDFRSSEVKVNVPEYGLHRKCKSVWSRHLIRDLNEYKCIVSFSQSSDSGAKTGQGRTRRGRRNMCPGRSVDM